MRRGYEVTINLDLRFITLPNIFETKTLTILPYEFRPKNTLSVTNLTADNKVTCYIRIIADGTVESQPVTPVPAGEKVSYMGVMFHYSILG